MDLHRVLIPVHRHEMKPAKYCNVDQIGFSVELDRRVDDPPLRLTPAAGLPLLNCAHY
jgi:hypothetical protein